MTAWPLTPIEDPRFPNPNPAIRTPHVGPKHRKEDHDNS
jgi:hypothetical protein